MWHNEIVVTVVVLHPRPVVLMQFMTGTSASLFHTFTSSKCIYHLVTSLLPFSAVALWDDKEFDDCIA